MRYLVLNEEFCTRNKDYSEGQNHFAYTKTNNDVFVTPECAKNDFPALFTNTNFQVVELQLSDFQPDYTPPASNGYGIVIPERFQWAFPIRIEGYTIPMFDHAGKKVVEASYLQWNKPFEAFRKSQHTDYKNAMMQIFIYANNNPEIITL